MFAHGSFASALFTRTVFGCMLFFVVILKIWIKPSQIFDINLEIILFSLRNKLRWCYIFIKLMNSWIIHRVSFSYIPTRPEELKVTGPSTPSFLDFFMITRCMFAYFWNMIKQVINNFFQSQKGESPINQIKK